MQQQGKLCTWEGMMRFYDYHMHLRSSSFPPLEQLIPHSNNLHLRTHLSTPNINRRRTSMTGFLRLSERGIVDPKHCRYGTKT